MKKMNVSVTHLNLRGEHPKRSFYLYIFFCQSPFRALYLTCKTNQCFSYKSATSFMMCFFSNTKNKVFYVKNKIRLGVNLFNVVRSAGFCFEMKHRFLVPRTSFQSVLPEYQKQIEPFTLCEIDDQHSHNLYNVFYILFTQMSALYRSNLVIDF